MILLELHPCIGGTDGLEVERGAFLRCGQKVKSAFLTILREKRLALSDAAPCFVSSHALYDVVAVYVTGHLARRGIETAPDNRFGSLE